MSTTLPMKHIVIEGMKHCGKSTHGRALAQVLKWPFFDTDELIVEGFSRHFDRRYTIREIFEEIGEKKFEAFEANVINGLAKKLEETQRRCVIALGGRPPCNPSLRPVLKSLGKIIYLRVPAELLFVRSTRRGPVPFLDPERPREHFFEIYMNREKDYLACADLVIPFGDTSVGEAQRLIIEAVRKEFKHWLDD